MAITANGNLSSLGMGAPVQQPGREMYMPMNGYMAPQGWVAADPHAYQQQMAAGPMMGQYAGYQMAPQMGQMATSGSYMNGGTPSYTMSMAPYMAAPVKPPQAGQPNQPQRSELRDMISMYLPADQDPTRMMAAAAPPAHVQNVYQQSTPPSSEGSSVPLTHM